MKNTQEKYLGSTFGFITLVSYDPETRIFTGECRCGAKVPMTELHAHRGSIHACPDCLKKYFPHRTRDITGKHYGVWKVLYPEIDDSGKIYHKWRCQCVKCGNEIVTPPGPLQGGSLYACRVCGAGEVLYEAMLRDFSLRGQHFGALEVRYALAGSDEWACHCACGNTEAFTREELLSHTQLDCGCGCGRRKE